MSTRTPRPAINTPAGYSLLVAIGAVVGYMIPNWVYAQFILFLRMAGTMGQSTRLASAVVMYLLGAVVYYGLFVAVVRLLQTYGFLKHVTNLHSRAHFLVYGYILLVVTDIGLAATPNSVYGSPWYGFMAAVMHGLLYAAVAGLMAGGAATIRRRHANRAMKKFK